MKTTEKVTYTSWIELLSCTNVVKKAFSGKSAILLLFVGLLQSGVGMLE
jgi:hypothetical protein